MKLFVLFIVFFLGLISGYQVTFDGHQILRLNIQTSQQLEGLRSFLPEDTDIWSREGTLGLGENDIRVNPAEKKYQLLLSDLEYLGIKHSVMIEDLQELIKQEKIPATNKKASFFDDYHTYDDYKNYCQKLCTENGNKCHFVPSVGKSVEGRDIFAVRVGRNANINSTNVRRIYFEGGQHAREWIGPITVIYILEQLLTGQDAAIEALLQKVEIDIVPLVNPDGYTYSRSSNRMWRKNRSTNSGSTCRGVDLNRNWDAQWATVGSSSNPCSDTYHGPKAFSEPETTAVSNWITKLNSEGIIEGAIDFHSYSQLFLRPYGWSYENCPDETDLALLGAGTTQQIQNIYGTSYQNIRSVDLYPTSGSAGDWFYESSSIWASYTIELRDTGRYGFVLPPSQIIPSGNETWSGIKFYLTEVYATFPRH